MTKISVMFVCLGNICRSPLAEAIFNQQVKSRNLESFFAVDSSGTANYHVNEEPDSRTIDIARKNNVPINHLGQQFNSTHFSQFDYIITMDQANTDNVLNIKNAEPNKVFKMRAFDQTASGLDVADPWFGDKTDFEQCYHLLDLCCTNLIEHIVDKHKI